MRLISLLFIFWFGSAYGQSRTAMPIYNQSAVLQAWALGGTYAPLDDVSDEQKKQFVVTALRIAFDPDPMLFPEVSSRSLVNAFRRATANSSNDYVVSVETIVRGLPSVIMCKATVSSEVTRLHSCQLTREKRNSEVHFLALPELRTPSADLTSLEFASARLAEIFPTIRDERAPLDKTYGGRLVKSFFSGDFSSQEMSDIVTNKDPEVTLFLLKEMSASVNELKKTKPKLDEAKLAELSRILIELSREK